MAMRAVVSHLRSVLTPQLASSVSAAAASARAFSISASHASVVSSEGPTYYEGGALDIDSFLAPFKNHERTGKEGH
jgi:hypothetical protein